MRYGHSFFDTLPERRNTRSIKWDGCAEKFGTDQELLPMWIADMDFRAPEEVVRAVTERAMSGIYGYSTKPDSFYEAIIRWMTARHGWSPKREEIIFIPGIIPGFNIAYQNFTAPGDGIIVQTPVYYPFMDGIRNNGRTMSMAPLRETDGYWEMDFDALERQVQDPANKLMILSNPHNPVGRCWTRAELERAGELCADNGVLLISDEVHSDLVMPGYSHCSAGSLPEKIRQNTIILHAPSKTFNLAGLQTAYAIIPNEAIRAKFEEGLNANRIFNMNWFGPVALETAYNCCGGYADALCAYVDANMDYMADYIAKHLPMLRMSKSEATYMVWVDFRGTGMTTEEIEDFIITKARIAVDMGTWFGPGGEGFLRFNLACPRVLVEQAMAQLTDAFGTI